MPSFSELTLADFDSDFLCKSCRSPLYQMFSSGIDACLNVSCADWPARYTEIVDSEEKSSPRILQELAEQKNQILERFRNCSLSSPRRFAYEERRRLSQEFLQPRAMRISDWQAVAELLAIAQSKMLSDDHENGIEEANFSRQSLPRPPLSQKVCSISKTSKREVSPVENENRKYWPKPLRIEISHSAPK